MDRSTSLRPPPSIRSVAELMAIAHAMEAEAARRYGELAERMRLLGEEELRATFVFLAGVEAKHVAQVDAQSLTLTGHAPGPAQVRWELPKTFDEEDARSALLTPHRALAIAVRNEERAFAFYSYIAAAAEDPALRRAAEELAHDELEHASLLRRERRKAWRRGRAAAETIQLPSSLAELRAAAAPRERAAAAAHRALATVLRTSSAEAASHLFESVAADEDSLADALEARLPVRPPFRPVVATTVRDGLRLLEQAFERYDEWVEHAPDEAVLNEAQHLAERALRRLAHVHGAIDNDLITRVAARG